MDKITLILLLLIAGTARTDAAPTISLPDDGKYYYWVRGASGSIKVPPRATDNSGQISLVGMKFVGGTLYVLDTHTGEIADVELASGFNGAQITVDQFHLPQSSAPAPPSAPPVPAPARVAAAAPVPSSTPPPSDDQPSLISTIISWVLGLAVFVGVVFFVLWLVRTKGRPLIDAARKMGIQLPDPEELPETNIEEDGAYEPPAPPKVQSVPDSAFKPQSGGGPAGFLTTDSGVSYEIGKRMMYVGREVGNDIILKDDSVSRRHARITPRGAGVAEVEDLDSSNGVFVNGEKITKQMIRPGDQVQIGAIGLRYED